MAHMAKDALGRLCLLFSIIFLNVFCWSGFSRGMHVLQNWELSKCMDGRTVSEPLSAVIGIGANDEDVRRRDNSKTINMRCSFLVAPYPCEEERDGECHRHAAEPLIADRGNWPHRIDVEDPGVTCDTKCRDLEWTCSDIGACNAYEKTVRLCISKLRMEPYDCWVNPNDLSGEARAEAPSFPAGWFAGSVVSVMLSLGVCSFYPFLLRARSDSKRDCCAKLVAHAIASACIAVIVVCLVFLVQVVLCVSIDDDGSSAVAKEVTLLDLATSMGIDPNATDAMSVRAEPEAEGSVLWTAGIVAISIAAGCCLVVVLRVLCSVLFKLRESAREQAIAGTKDGASETRDRRIPNWSQEGLVICPISFKLKAADPVRVDSNKENVERLCTDSGVMWIDEKAAYLGRDGSVMGTDFVGSGVRVKFSDGHWWYFHPSCLWIHAEKLSPTRKEDLEKRDTQVADAA